MTHSGSLPASVRLVDNTQFKFSQALKPASKGLKVIKSQVEKAFVTKVKGFDPDQMVACTLVFEGTLEEVEAQEERLRHRPKVQRDGGRQRKRRLGISVDLRHRLHPRLRDEPLCPGGVV